MYTNTEVNNTQNNYTEVSQNNIIEINESNIQDVIIINENEETYNPSLHDEFQLASNATLMDGTNTSDLCINTNQNMKRLLILGDDNAKHINYDLRKFLDSNIYDIRSIIKPGAVLSQVIDNIDPVVQNFTLEDHIIVIAGSNDFDVKRTPSFRFICDKLKTWSHTNIIFTSIPYLRKNTINHQRIFKYNYKLNSFLNKFNNCTEGHTKYLEINRKTEITSLRKRISESLLSVLRFPSPSKNLKFIRSVENTRQVTDENFLYPRLSQLDLLP